MAPPKICASLRRRCCACFSPIQQAAEKHIARARKIIKGITTDAGAGRMKAAEMATEAALRSVDAALQTSPGHAIAMEMKARLLMRLRRFSDVVQLLHHHLPHTDGQGDGLMNDRMINTTNAAGREICMQSSPASSIASATSCHTERTHLLYSGQLEPPPHDDAQLYYAVPRRSGVLSAFAAITRNCCNRALLQRCWLWRSSFARCSRGWKKKKAPAHPQWQYLVLGRACWHLGMLEDAMALLQQRKKTASAASRKQSNSVRGDRFIFSSDHNDRHSHYRRVAMGRTIRRRIIRCRIALTSSEEEEFEENDELIKRLKLQMHLWRQKLKLKRDDAGLLSPATIASEEEEANKILHNIKLLLRRRSAAMAAMETGLYAESARHLTKILEAKKLSSSSTAMAMPQGFASECYLQRAIANAAMARVADAIADCNRSLALKPGKAAALSLRASLLEMVRSYSDCLLDLQQLRLIYQRKLRHQDASDYSSSSLYRHQDASGASLTSVLGYVDGKIDTIRQKLADAANFRRLDKGGANSIDAHSVLSIAPECSPDDARRAFLLLSLKHRVDKAGHFVDRCEFADVQVRDAEAVREEAMASAARLSQLIRMAYRQLLSSMAAGRGDSSSDEEETAEEEGGSERPAGECYRHYNFSSSFTSDAGEGQDSAESIKDAWSFRDDDDAAVQCQVISSARDVSF